MLLRMTWCWNMIWQESLWNWFHLLLDKGTLNCSVSSGPSIWGILPRQILKFRHINISDYRASNRPKTTTGLYYMVMLATKDSFKSCSSFEKNVTYLILQNSKLSLMENFQGKIHILIRYSDNAMHYALHIFRMKVDIRS